MKNPLIYNCDFKRWKKKVEKKTQKKSWKMERLNFENLGFVKIKIKLRLHLSLIVGNDFATEFHSTTHQPHISESN